MVFLTKFHLSLTVLRPADGSFVQVNAENSDFPLDFESELPADHSSTTALVTDPHKLVRPIAPAADPELLGVTHTEWIPPKMEEDVIAELIDKQLKKLLSARPKKVKNVKATTSTVANQELTSPRALCQDFAGHPKNSDSKLSQTPEKMTGMRSPQPPSYSQNDSETNIIEASQLLSRQGAQQMLYLAVPMPYVLAGGYLPENSDPTTVPGTAVPLTTEQNLNPLVTELKSPQYSINTSSGIGEFKGILEKCLYCMFIQGYVSSSLEAIDFRDLKA